MNSSATCAFSDWSSRQRICGGCRPRRRYSSHRVQQRTIFSRDCLTRVQSYVENATARTFYPALSCARVCVRHSTIWGVQTRVSLFKSEAPTVPDWSHLIFPDWGINTHTTICWACTRFVLLVHTLIAVLSHVEEFRNRRDRADPGAAP